MTAAGKKALEEELQRLKSVERPRIIKAIEEARAHGDLSENAEYSYAKDQQGQTEARIRMLEDTLSRAEVIAPQNGKPERVVFGVLVKAVDVDNERDIHFRIVGEHESNPPALISYTSPLGKAFIGKRVGDEVAVPTPGGTRTYEINDIEA